MKHFNEQVQTLLNRHQVVLIWIGIVIVLLLIALVMMSWVTMLKVSLLEQNSSLEVSTAPTNEPEMEPELIKEEIKATALTDLEEGGTVVTEADKAVIYESRLKPSTATEADKAAALQNLVDINNNQ